MPAQDTTGLETDGSTRAPSSEVHDSNEASHEQQSGEGSSEEPAQ